MRVIVYVPGGICADCCPYGGSHPSVGDAGTDPPWSLDRDGHRRHRRALVGEAVAQAVEQPPRLRQRDREGVDVRRGQRSRDPVDGARDVGLCVVRLGLPGRVARRSAGRRRPRPRGSRRRRSRRWGRTGRGAPRRPRRVRRRDPQRRLVPQVRQVPRHREGRQDRGSRRPPAPPARPPGRSRRRRAGAAHRGPGGRSPRRRRLRASPSWRTAGTPGSSGRAARRWRPPAPCRSEGSRSTDEPLRPRRSGGRGSADW